MADEYIYHGRRAMAITEGWENRTRYTAWTGFAVWVGESARVGSEHITRARNIALRVRKIPKFSMSL